MVRKRRDLETDTHRHTEKQEEGQGPGRQEGEDREGQKGRDKATRLSPPVPDPSSVLERMQGPG